MQSREYHIYSIPVFVFGETDPNVDVSEFCSMVQETFPSSMLRYIDVCYICDDPVLDGRNAAYSNGAIYMTAQEPTVEDMFENFAHELAHSYDHPYASFIYDDRLTSEFIGKRKKLYHLLVHEGYRQMPERVYGHTEYNSEFDNFLANTVGYPTLLSLTMGLFCSPYGATSIQEYFANGFEKYYTESPEYVRNISPVLYAKVKEIIDDTDS